MKRAAVYALASLAKESLCFGRDYFIPEPSDSRLMRTIAPAVAKAAIESGVAKETIDDFEAYANDLDKRIFK